MKKCSQRKSAPDTNSLEKIARFFRADLTWLITGNKSTVKPNSLVGEKLKPLLKKQGWSLDEFAKKLSLNPTVLDFYLKGYWPISMDLLYDFARILKVPPYEFLIDEESSPVKIPELKIFQASSTKGLPKIREEDYISIPLTESSIAAGQPIIQENNIEDYVLLHIRAAGKRDNLVASKVDGESMEPMLHSGDIIVIDRNDKKILSNKMYAIFYEDGLTAKYVERQKNLLILRPVNPSAKVQVIDLNENPDPIVGRIMGAWKEL